MPRHRPCGAEQPISAGKASSYSAYPIGAPRALDTSTTHIYSSHDCGIRVARALLQGAERRSQNGDDNGRKAR